MGIELAKVDAIIEKHGTNRRDLIPLLLDLQSEFHYLDKEALARVASKTNLPVMQVYQVARFYKAFSLKPRGKHTVCVCTGTACRVRGSESHLQQIAQLLHITPGGTTEDGKLTLETANCPGSCAVGPVLMIDEKQYGRIDDAQLDSVLKQYSKDKEAGSNG